MRTLSCVILGCARLLRLVSRAGQRLNYGGEFENFEVGGAVFPIVLPTHDYVTAAGGMAVVPEIAALKFKFDVHPLPPFRTDAALCLAVGESYPHGFHQEAQLLGKHSKQKDHALFVQWLVAQPAKVDRVAIHGTAASGNRPG